MAMIANGMNRNPNVGARYISPAARKAALLVVRVESISRGDVLIVFGSVDSPHPDPI